MRSIRARYLSEIWQKLDRHSEEGHEDEPGRWQKNDADPHEATPGKRRLRQRKAEEQRGQGDDQPAGREQQCKGR